MKEIKEVYVISAWYEENGETKFIFNREIDYTHLFPWNEDIKS